MPRIDRERIGVAFDMQGCPNRCRHCWLGIGNSSTLSEADVRWGVSQFREFIGSTNTTIRHLAVATWFREPDFSDDYRHLYDLEEELGDGKPNRYELLSVWRLARDTTYADWAKAIGPDTCQISFAGMKDTTDWFHRRTGAFDDALAASDRLLNVGMKPRWQLFLTTKLLPEIDDFLDLVAERRLVDRVREIGDEFRLFMHPPGPDDEGRKIEAFRPTADQVADLPESILRASRTHFQKRTLWQTEAALHAAILKDVVHRGDQGIMPDVLWFLVCSNWDVFANIGTLEPWWRLGNLREDSVETTIRRFEQDDVLGLQARLHKGAVDLANTYGDADGQKIYSDAGDLVSLYRAKHCEHEWSRR